MSECCVVVVDSARARFFTLEATQMPETEGGPNLIEKEDLVNSGLEETMITAYNNVREIMRMEKDKIDMRTAAFIDAIDKVAVSYKEMGIFP